MSEVIVISSDDEENALKSVEGNCKSTKSKHEGNHEGPISCDGVSVTSFEFERFLDYCADIDMKKRKGNVRSMKRIMDRLRRRFKDADPEYTSSHVFKETLSAAMKVVEKEHKSLFVHVKQVDDELKARGRKKTTLKRKAADEEGETMDKRLKEDSVVCNETKTSNGQIINERNVQKLERLFHKVYRKTKKLQEREVDWDEDEDSAYMRFRRYEKRLYLIWEKWQEARGHLDEVKRLKFKRVAFSGTSYPKLNHAIELFLNKTRCFPDFHDILKLAKETLNTEGENMSQEDLEKIAASAFRSVGNQLQKRRVFDFWNSLLTYLPSDINGDVGSSDPAEKDEILACALKKSQGQQENKMNEVINQFVERQVEEKLEPIEVLPGTEDEEYRSGEEEEEEQEEDDDPECITILSSTSDESDVGEGAEQENCIGDARPSKKDNAEDAKEWIVLKEEDESEACGGKTDSLVNKSKISLRSLSSSVQSKLNAEEVESTMCSFTHKNSTIGKISKEKKDDAADILLVSESDSDQ